MTVLKKRSDRRTVRSWITADGCKSHLFRSSARFAWLSCDNSRWEGYTEIAVIPRSKTVQQFLYLWDSASLFSSGFVDPADGDRSRRCATIRRRRIEKSSWCYRSSLLNFCRTPAFAVFAKASSSRSLRLNDLVSHCVAHQLADRVAVQTGHDVRPMCFCRFNANSELDRHFLAAFTFRQ